MIAVKREVAARIERVFRGANVKLENWRQVTVQNRIFLRKQKKKCRVGMKRVAKMFREHTDVCTVTTCRASKQYE